MANQTGRPVAPARKLVAAVLGTFAVFVMVFGLGLSSWPIVALGAALLALAIALGMVNVVRRGARAWVAGHGQVKAISEPPASGAYGRAEMQLVVVAPGLSVTEVMVREPRIPVGKWPRPGETLPITVDVDDLRRVRIDWSQVDDRAVDGDPPPPSFEPAEEFIDDDLLGDPEPPPWANRDRSWGRGPAEPSSPAADYPEYADEELHQSSVVVHDTPGGPVVEGTVVNEDDIPRVLPQRAPRPAPPPAAPPTSPADPAADASSTSSPASSAPASSPPASSSADAHAARSSADPAAYPAPSAAEASPSSAAAASSAAEQASASTATVDDEQSSAAETESMPDAQPPPAETERRRPSPRPRRPSEPTSEETPDPFSGTPSGPTNATPGPGTPQPGVVPEQRGAGDAGYDAVPPEPAAARSAPVDHDIDLPLDDQSHRGEPTTDLPLVGDPEPAPEFGPDAREAVDEGVIAPPADADPPPAGRAWVVGSSAASPPTRDAPFPDPDDVAAYPASAGSESTRDAEVTRPAPTRNDPQRDTDVAATANQATPDADDTPSSPNPDDVAAYPANQDPPTPDINASDEDQAPSNPEDVAASQASPAPDGVDDSRENQATPNPDVAAYPASQAPPDADTQAPIAPHAPRPWEASSTTPDPEVAAPPTDQNADAPVITGVDAPVESRGPSTGAAGAGAAAAAAAGAAASKSQDKPEAQHGPGSPWADLEGGGYQPDEHADEIITAYPSARPGPAGAIHGVGITVLVTDLERSTAFYRDTLGFFQIDNGPGSAVLASGDTRLVLRTVHSLASDIGRLIYLNLEVGDVDAVYDELKAKGVKFLHGPRPVNRGDKLELWAATFYDPDGHNIAVTQWRAIR